jgi:hypothetical protein
VHRADATKIKADYILAILRLLALSYKDGTITDITVLLSSIYNFAWQQDVY